MSCQIEIRPQPRRPSFVAVTAATLLAAGLLATSAQAEGKANWTPTASEKLVKLPARYLKKAIDKDFAGSPLAPALRSTTEKVELKAATLRDLQNAAAQADGDLKVELSRQFLAEKQAYLKLVGAQQKLRQQRARANVRVYERLLGKINRSKGAMVPQRVALIELQEKAQQRFKASLANVDAKLFGSALTAESRYAQEYAKNVTAIERLAQAINNHPANARPTMDGADLTKEDFVRQLIASNEADLAILEQEQSILGTWPSWFPSMLWHCPNRLAGVTPRLPPTRRRPQL